MAGVFADSGGIQYRTGSRRHLPHPHAQHAQAGDGVGQRRCALFPVACPNQRHHQFGKEPGRQQAQGPHLSIIREAEVDANLKRAQALRQATLSKQFRK